MPTFWMEERKIGARKFDMAFYKGPDLRKVEVPEGKTPALDLQELIEQLKQPPEWQTRRPAVGTQNSYGRGI